MKFSCPNEAEKKLRPHPWTNFVYDVMLKYKFRFKALENQTHETQVKDNDHNN